MSVSTEAEPHSSMQPTSTSRWKLVALRAEGSGQRAVGAGNCGQARTPGGTGPRGTTRPALTSRARTPCASAPIALFRKLWGDIMATVTDPSSWIG